MLWSETKYNVVGQLYLNFKKKKRNRLNIHANTWVKKMKDREKMKSHMGELLIQKQDMGVRLEISSAGPRGNDFSPEYLRRSPEVSVKGMKESDVDTSHLFTWNIWKYAPKFT